MADTGRENVVRRNADGVLEALLLQHAVQPWDGERHVTAKILRYVAIPFLHATIDMGAHDFGASPFDRNHDGRVDLDDFSEFMKAFTGP